MCCQRTQIITKTHSEIILKHTKKCAKRMLRVRPKERSKNGVRAVCAFNRNNISIDRKNSDLDFKFFIRVTPHHVHFRLGFY